MVMIPSNQRTPMPVTKPAAYTGANIHRAGSSVSGRGESGRSSFSCPFLVLSRRKMSQALSGSSSLCLGVFGLQMETVSESDKSSVLSGFLSLSF